MPSNTKFTTFTYLVCAKCSHNANMHWNWNQLKRRFQAQCVYDWEACSSACKKVSEINLWRCILVSRVGCWCWRDVMHQPISCSHVCTTGHGNWSCVLWFVHGFTHSLKPCDVFHTSFVFYLEQPQEIGNVDFII